MYRNSALYSKVSIIIDVIAWRVNAFLECLFFLLKNTENKCHDVCSDWSNWQSQKEGKKKEKMLISRGNKNKNCKNAAKVLGGKDIKLEKTI